MKVYSFWITHCLIFLISTDLPKNLIYLVISRISSTNSGATTPQDIGNRSIENSDTEFEDYYRYESGHIALDYGTGKHGIIKVGFPHKINLRMHRMYKFQSF